MTLLSKGQGSNSGCWNCKTGYSVLLSHSVSEAANMSTWIVLALLAVSCAVPVWSSVEDEASAFLIKFEEEAIPIVYNSSLASWAYNTNITKENAEATVSIPAVI